MLTNQFELGRAVDNPAFTRSSDLNLRASELPSRAAIAGTDFNPIEYKNVASLVQHKGAHYLLSLYQFRGDEQVLEVGCGDGTIAAEQLHRLVPNGSVLATDISVEMIDYAKELYPSGEYPRLQFLECDVRNLSETLASDQLFDVVFSNFALHWLHDAESQFSVLAQIAGKLTDEGNALLLFSSEGTFQELFDAAYAVMKRPEWSSYFQNGKLRHPALPHIESIQVALERVGLGCEHFELAENWRYFSDAEQLTKWFEVCIRPFMKPLEKCDPATQHKFAEEVVEQYQRDLRSISDYPLHTDIAPYPSGIFLRDITIVVKAKSY